MNNFISVLHSPTKTFEGLRDRGGGFAVAFILLLVFTLISAYLQIPIVERMMDAQEIETPGVSQETLKTITILFQVIGAPIFVAAWIFILGLLFLLVNLIVRGEATYWQLVKVAVYSSIPSVINGLLTGILARNTDAQTHNDLVISAGALFSEKEGFLFGLANILNPFSIWTLAIMIIGVSVMARKSASSVAIWIGGAWLIINIIMALFA
jgi:hypothetical protein